MMDDRLIIVAMNRHTFSLIIIFIITYLKYHLNNLTNLSIKNNVKPQTNELLKHSWRAIAQLHFTFFFYICRWNYSQFYNVILSTRKLSRELWEVFFFSFNTLRLVRFGREEARRCHSRTQRSVRNDAACFPSLTPQPRAALDTPIFYILSPFRNPSCISKPNYRGFYTKMSASREANYIFFLFSSNQQKLGYGVYDISWHRNILFIKSFFVQIISLNILLSFWNNTFLGIYIFLWSSFLEIGNDYCFVFTVPLSEEFLFIQHFIENEIHS